MLNPIVASAAPTVRNAIIGAIVSWWDTNCYPNPDWQSLTHLHTSEWYRYKTDIMSAINELSVQLQKYRAHRQKIKIKMAGIIRANVLPANERRYAEKRLRQREENPYLSHEKETHVGINAVTSPRERFNSGTFDPIAVQQAKEKKAANKGKKMMFYDKPKE